MTLTGTLPLSPADTFSDRVLALVSFMVESHGKLPNMRRCEQDVGDWISGWRRKEGKWAEIAQHFASTELGIVLRVLNGPASTGPRFEDSANQQLCWLLARCLSQQA